MYTPNRVTVYDYQTFASLSGGTGTHVITLNVVDKGYPAQATAVEVLLGCHSWSDGAYMAAYDGLEPDADRIAAYPVAPMRNLWAFATGRVELDASRFLLRIRPLTENMEVLVVLKGYHTP